MEMGSTLWKIRFFLHKTHLSINVDGLWRARDEYGSPRTKDIPNNVLSFKILGHQSDQIIREQLQHKNWTDEIFQSVMKTIIIPIGYGIIFTPDVAASQPVFPPLT